MKRGHMNQVKTSLFFILVLFCLVGCSSKEPEIIVRTEYQEKKVPVRCINQMPVKPIWDTNNPSYSYDLLLKYYELIEKLLEKCTKHGENTNG
nr:MAG TPA: lipoprotein [Caudoviricetes sp.]